MLKVAKLIFILLFINIVFANETPTEISVDDIELAVEDHLKGTIDEKVIKDAMKFEYVNKENNKENSKNGQVEIKETQQENTNNNQEDLSAPSADEKKENEKQEKKSSLDANIFEEIKGAYRIRSQDELRYLLELSDLTFLKFSYIKNSKNSMSVAKYIKTISEKLNYLAGIILIDCETFTPQHHDDCQIYDYINDSFPRLKLLIPPEKRYDPLLDAWETHFELPWTEKEMTESSIYNYIVSNIPNKAVKIDINTSYGFFSTNTMNKVVLFTDKSTPTLLFKGITNYFHDRIAFGMIKKDQEELIKRFNITKFPTLMLYKTIDRKRLLDEPETVIYEGLPKAEKLVEFIEPHTLVEKFHYKMKRGVVEHDIRELSQNLEFTALTIKNYEKIFQKLGEKNIVVYFDKKYRLKNSFKQYFIKNYGFFHTFFFDCSEAKKFCYENFGVEKFPSLKLFKTNSTVVSEKVKNPINLPYTNHEVGNLTLFFNNTFNYNYKNLTNIEFPYFMTEAKFNKKYVIGYFSENREEDDIDSFALLSSDKHLRENFEFVYLNKPELDNRKKYKIFNSPSIYVFFERKDEFKTIMLQPSSIFETLRTIAYSLEYYKTQKLVTRSYFSELVPQVEDNFALRKNCLDLNECVLFLFSAKDDQARIEEFDFMMRKLENVRAKPFLEKVKFSWLNITCHSDFLERMEINAENTPGIVYLFPWRTAYAYYNNYFEDFPLTEFFQKAMQGRTENKYIKRDNIYLSNRNCEDAELENDDTGLDAHVEFKGEIQQVKAEKLEEINLDNTGNATADKKEETKKSDL